MKILTSFAKITTPEGERISFTYSEVNEVGVVTSRNNKGGFIIGDENLKAHVSAIESYISRNYISQK